MKKSNYSHCKKIIIIFLIIMQLSIFIMPNYSYADKEKDEKNLWDIVGERMLKPIINLLCGIGDAAIELLQNVFITSNTSIAIDGDYLIRYSPGIIFSGQVRGLDINFLSPLEDEEKYHYGQGWSEIFHMFEKKEGKELTDEEWNQFISEIQTKLYDSTLNLGISKKTIDQASIDSTFEFKYGSEVYRIKKARLSSDKGKYYLEFAKLTINEGSTGEWNKSIAGHLRPTVASWYKATRRISIVGLLSILLYVGIRIIISSAAADKAKYKKMFMDWLTALCLLFILHYIMVFILNISQQLTNIFTIDDVNQGVDQIISNIRRNTMNAEYYVTERCAFVFMYLSLVLLTFVFTFQYLKRVIYMAFLTMMAPLIALTYPLDKIKDGQAQAFTMWLREYIFNSLIQPLHLLIYVMLVGTATDLVSQQPLYAIIAISFIVPAEKFLRKMFGFEKASTVSKLGAAAAGAGVMSAINKLKQVKGGGHSSSGEKTEPDGANTVPIRTADTSPVQAVPQAEPEPDIPRDQGVQMDMFKDFGVPYPNRPGTASATNQTVRAAANVQGLRNIAAVKPRERGTMRKIGGVINAVGKRYKLWGRGSIRQWNKRILSTLGAGTMGMIGMAAGLATGDLSNVFKYGAAGTAAGYAAGHGITDRVGDNLVDLGNTLQRGYQGEEDYQQNVENKEFYRSSEYLYLKQHYKQHHKLRQYTRDFLDAGISDVRKIERALNAGLSSEDAVVYCKLASGCPPEIINDKGKFVKYLESQNIDTSNAQGIYDKMKMFI